MPVIPVIVESALAQNYEPKVQIPILEPLIIFLSQWEIKEQTFL